jgi:TMEM175 potassium channel family protein
MSKKQLGSFDRDSVEFGRALTFTDGVFAIAVTLLVVGIQVPNIPDTQSVSELADALNDNTASYISFVISFLVIGRYWLAHHQFCSRLARMDQGILAINMIYLLFVAFLPFPTAVLGNYFENPLSVIIYAISVALVSGMEVVLFAYARNKDLLMEKLPDDVFRWGALMSISPVVFFVLSIPVAFVSSSLAVVLCFGAVPLGRIAQRWKPADADDFLIS